MSDSVNNPKHYNFGAIEVIDAIESWGLGFCLGNTVKYIARAKHKGSELEDLKKARWYLNREISNLERKEAEATVLLAAPPSPFEAPQESAMTAAFAEAVLRQHGRRMRPMKQKHGRNSSRKALGGRK